MGFYQDGVVNTTTKDLEANVGHGGARGDVKIGTESRGSAISVLAKEKELYALGCGRTLRKKQKVRNDFSYLEARSS